MGEGARGEGVRSGPEVTILLAAHRSEAHLGEQLASFAAQTHRAWRLVVSDDAPTPASAAILDAFARAHPGRVERVAGPGRGFAANFLSLLARAPADAPVAALSDHDDVWLPERLARAVAALEAVPAGRPALYCAATLVCDARLRPLGPSPAFPRPPSFGNALVQSLGGGNTMALNRAGLDLAAAAAREAGPVVAHDWWLYQIVSGAGGAVLRDPEPVLLYRQHGGNLFGANRSVPARLGRLLGLLGGRLRGWNEVNLAALARSAHRFTPEAQAQLQAFAAARGRGFRARARALRASGAHRQGGGDDLALRLACLLGRL